MRSYYSAQNVTDVALYTEPEEIYLMKKNGAGLIMIIVMVMMIVVMMTMMAQVMWCYMTPRPRRKL